MKKITCFFNTKKEKMLILFGMDFKLKNWLVINFKLREDLCYNSSLSKSIHRYIYHTSKKLNDKDNEIFINILESLVFEIYKAIRGEYKSGRYKLSKDNFKKRNFEGQGTPFIISSNKNDIYTRLEVLLELKLPGHTDTLTDASNLNNELYKRGEIQNEQQYRNALNKLRTQKWNYRVNY